MTTHSALLYNVNSCGVAEITLNRPEIRNAFDDKLISQLTDRFKQAESTPEVRVILLNATGKHFSAGADLNWMKGMVNASIEENLADAKRLAQLMFTINHNKKPVVTRVQGAAFGGAIGLIACSDIIIADKDSKYALSEVKLGLSPATISPYVIDAIGQRRARHLFLTGEVFDAEKAMEIGLVSEIVPTTSLNDRTEQIIALLLTNGPIALTKTKSLIEHVAKSVRDQQLTDYTCQLIADLRVSEEGQEGLSAFFEKRPPQWSVTQPSPAKAAEAKKD